MNAVKDDVIELVGKELASANKRFPPFRSPHEGYAVILEELQEAQDELCNSIVNFDQAWGLIKADQYPYSHVRRSYNATVDAICELIQYAAMQRKFLDMEEQNEGEHP
ncbi:hypothetical protein [Intestinibacillus massiliensis]|uniref:hypothetical protein n=1 Tax=Intestinibacillus massiliensis TaxID=1871029 RepID=UPI000B3517A4|nr:hypothetical protein [Intestinibacillus massiliensis]